jgi:hypothetical protein
MGWFREAEGLGEIKGLVQMKWKTNQCWNWVKMKMWKSVLTKSWRPFFSLHRERERERERERGCLPCGFAGDLSLAYFSVSGGLVGFLMFRR